MFGLAVSNATPIALSLSLSLFLTPAADSLPLAQNMLPSCITHMLSFFH